MPKDVKVRILSENKKKKITENKKTGIKVRILTERRKNTVKYLEKQLLKEDSGGNDWRSALARAGFDFSVMDEAYSLSVTVDYRPHGTPSAASGVAFTWKDKEGNELKKDSHWVGEGQRAGDDNPTPFHVFDSLDSLY